MLQTPRFSEITTLAYKELIRCNFKTLPIRQTDFADNTGKQIILISFQKYIELSGSGIKLEELTLGSDFNDGYAVSELRPGLRMILFNEETHPQRLWYTIYHEVGHFKCGHSKHGSIEEIEAHFFASQLLMPNSIIKYLVNSKYSITHGFLMDCFGVSSAAAKKKIDYLQKYGYHHTHPYDDTLVELFKDGLERRYPLLIGLNSNTTFKNIYGDESSYKNFLLNEQAFIDPDY